MLTEGLVVHEKVDDFSFSSFEPGEEFLSGKRPVRPTLVGKTESDVITEGIIPEQELEVLLKRIRVDVIRVLPSEDMTGAFGQHGLEPKVIDLPSNGIGINHLSVPESFRGHSEMVLDGLYMLLHLMLEFALVGKGCQGMVICFREELNASGSCQFLEGVDHFRLVPVELLQR